jgi:tellurite resistance protein
MDRHKTRARNALVNMLRDIKKAKEPAPNVIRCAVARAEQMREVVKSVGVEIDVQPVEDFPWDKFQLLRENNA